MSMFKLRKISLNDGEFVVDYGTSHLEIDYILFQQAKARDDEYEAILDIKELIENQ